MVCGKCKMNNTNIVCYCNSCFQNARIKSKEEGRVEGAIKELVDLQHYICSDININEKDLLKFIDKRLKVLGGKI